MPIYDVHESEENSISRAIRGYHTSIDLEWVRQRLQCGLQPEIEMRLAAYIAAIRMYHKEVIAGEFPSYSLIEGPKIYLADAFLKSLDFPTQPLSREELVPPKKKPSLKVSPPGFVYLMRNCRNAYIKIGFSKAPQAREKTLQAEDPDIQIIYSFKANARTERILHLKYAELRIRGEWFRLTDIHIKEICEYFGVASA